MTGPLDGGGQRCLRRDVEWVGEASAVVEAVEIAAEKEIVMFLRGGTAIAPADVAVMPQKQWRRSWGLGQDSRNHVCPGKRRA